MVLLSIRNIPGFPGTVVLRNVGTGFYTDLMFKDLVRDPSAKLRIIDSFYAEVETDTVVVTFWIENKWYSFASRGEWLSKVSGETGSWNNNMPSRLTIYKLVKKFKELS